MTKPAKWHVLPATHISLGIRPVWSEFSLSAWRKLGSWATHWAHSEDSDQTGQMPRLVWVFAGHTCHFVGIVMRLHKCSSQINVQCLKSSRNWFLSRQYRSTPGQAKNVRLLYKLEQSKTYKRTMPESDCPYTLWSVLAVPMKSWEWNMNMNCMDVQTDLSLCWVHVILQGLLCSGSYGNWIVWFIILGITVFRVVIWEGKLLSCKKQFEIHHGSFSV